MALRELNILNDCIEAISNQSLILDINNKAFLDDIQTLLAQYFETFNKVLNEMEYDNFSVDFFVDYGKLIIYPEKKMPEDLIDMFDAERLDPYCYLVFEEYLKYFENLNVSEEVFDREFESKTNDVIDCVSKAIKNINEKDKILEMLGKPKLEIRYFGVTKEELLKSEILQK